MSTAQEKKPRITYLLATFNREKFLRPLFANPRAWQVLDAFVAAAMFGIGLKLVL